MHVIVHVYKAGSAHKEIGKLMDLSKVAFAACHLEGVALFAPGGGKQQQGVGIATQSVARTWYVGIIRPQIAFANDVI
jgi:hypothetical protein